MTTETKTEDDKSIAKKKTKGLASGGTSTSSNYRSELGIEELRGHIFTYGNKTQTDKYLKTRKALGEYVGTKYGRRMWCLVVKKKEAEFPDPDDPGEDATRAQLEKFKMLLRVNIEDEKKYREDKALVFRLILGQCTTTMRNKIEAAGKYAALEDNDDVVGLLELIRELVYITKKTQAAMRRLVGVKQESKESLSSFVKRFEAQVEATENVWGLLVPHKMKGQLLTEQEKGRSKFMACLFLGAVDRARYKQAIDDLNNDYLLGNINYPEGVGGMLSLLANRRGAGSGGSRQIDDYNDGADVGVMSTSFNQAVIDGEESDTESQSKQMKRVMCYACGEKGHIAKAWPKFAGVKSIDGDADTEKKKKKVNAFMKDSDDDGDDGYDGWFRAASFD
jgi:hypothetical protein